MNKVSTIYEVTNRERHKAFDVLISPPVRFLGRLRPARLNHMARVITWTLQMQKDT
jgi:hypothetical protein